MPAADGAREAFRQVPYACLVPGPANAEGGVWRLPIGAAAIAGTKHKADRRLANEARQVARFLRAGGPSAVGAPDWNSVCVIVPRTRWLAIIRDAFEAEGLKTALQLRRNRNGDNPAYAWLCGLLAVVCDPENTFEWVGVLREVFAVSDAMIADAVAGNRPIRWDEPEAYPEPLGRALSILIPFITRVNDEGDSLGRFASELSAACGLRSLARLVDQEGGLDDELARLLAHADQRGSEGAGPREWHRDLLSAIDGFRASGRPEPDAVNLITAHSAKGLEWPVVIPLGLWREPGFKDPHGLRILSEDASGPRVILDAESLDPKARESRDRGRLRELVRLLYVTVTRPRTALIIPWCGATVLEEHCFAGLWGFDPAQLEPLPEPPAAASAEVEAVLVVASEAVGIVEVEGPGPAPDLPKRILPHQLASDNVRAYLHEAGSDGPNPVRDAPDPLEYGVWWHETVERLPWETPAEELEAYGAAAVRRASELGFGARAREEWDRFLASEPYQKLREARWTRLAEAGILAPFREGEWIDGVVDLIVHDPKSNEVWIVDWKTNRKGRAEGDSDLLARLVETYAGQLVAYGSCATPFFPGCRISLWVYSTVAGQWSAIAGS